MQVAEHAPGAGAAWVLGALGAIFVLIGAWPADPEDEARKVKEANHRTPLTPTRRPQPTQPPQPPQRKPPPARLPNSLATVGKLPLSKEAPLYFDQKNTRFNIPINPDRWSRKVVLPADAKNWWVVTQPDRPLFLRSADGKVYEHGQGKKAALPGNELRVLAKEGNLNATVIIARPVDLARGLPLAPGDAIRFEDGASELEVRINASEWSRKIAIPRNVTNWSVTAKPDRHFFLRTERGGVCELGEGRSRPKILGETFRLATAAEQLVATMTVERKIELLASLRVGPWKLRKLNWRGPKAFAVMHRTPVVVEARANGSGMTVMIKTKSQHDRNDETKYTHRWQRVTSIRKTVTLHKGTWYVDVINRDEDTGTGLGTVRISGPR